MSNEWELPSDAQPANIERIGGGFAWESGVYDAVVKMVHLHQADSKAVSFNVELENRDGKSLKETFWIKSGNEKGNKTYYTKDGKNYPLPGYSVAESLCIAATGLDLAECMKAVEKKTIKIYNHEQGKEVPTEVPVIMDLLDKPVKVAVHQITENKRKKNDATGKYENTGETRTINECKFFGNTEGKTADEIKSKSEAIMFDKWAEKNTGTVIDKTDKGASVPSAAAIMGGQSNTSNTNQATKSLFS